MSHKGKNSENFPPKALDIRKFKSELNLCIHFNFFCKSSYFTPGANFSAIFMRQNEKPQTLNSCQTKYFRNAGI